MPDSVCDVKLLKKTVEENRKIVIKADKKIEKTAEAIKRGIYPQEGINILYHIAGLLAQRLWFYGKTKGYSDKIKISNDCVGCSVCSISCPMKNITIKNKKAVAEDRCTMCYRCISLCPQKAITLLGKEIHEQCRFEKYI